MDTVAGPLRFIYRTGHSVAIFDNFIRRQWDYELGVQTLTPIPTLSDRLKIWEELTGKHGASK
jgi:UDP-sulfoquinovose synthase